MIVSINTEKVFETPMPFPNKNIQRTRRETPSKGRKGIFEKMTADIILNDVRLKTLLLRSRTDKDACFHHCCLTQNKKF